MRLDQTVRQNLIHHIDRLNLAHPRRIQAGCYQLIFSLPRPVTISVGSLGNLRFPAGVCIYTGSHQRSLHQRVLRHLKIEKKIYWHIDFLTSGPQFPIAGVILYPGQHLECEIHQAFRTFSGSAVLHPGFGNGDCRHKCGSHLLYCPEFSPHILRRWHSAGKRYQPIFLSIEQT